MIKNSFMKFKEVCPRTLKDMAILTFKMAEVCVLLDRFFPTSGTAILSLYIILPNFIKIGLKLFETINIQTH